MIRELEKAKRFKSQIRRGEARLGVQIGLADPAVVEILGRAGYDWLLVDTEHAASNTLTVQAMLQASAQTEALVLARVLRLDPDEIRRFLDIGSPGVVCPFINSEDARRLVSACRYPPQGIRGYGPRRAGIFGFDATEYFQTANDAILCIPIIESKDAIEKIEEIVATDGIDMVMIGPVDLSISLGIFMQYDHPRYLSAIEKSVRPAGSTGRRWGQVVIPWNMPVDVPLQETSSCSLGGDDSFMAAEARRVLEAVRPK